MRRTALALVAAVMAMPAAAQETRPLTEDAAAAIADFYNRPTTTRLRGESRIAAGATVDGDVASLGGVLVVAGTITGDVVVINGDLRLTPGAAVHGSARVVGGRAEGQMGAVTGGIVVYRDRLRFRQEGDRLVGLGPAAPAWPGAGWTTAFGRAELVVAMDGSYNRVDGFPLSFGPRLQVGHSNPTVLDARLIYRTRTGLRIHPAELAHELTADQFLGGHGAIHVGVGLRRVTEAIEHAGLSDTENSLATFIIHRDYRDHYWRHGWSAHLGFIGLTRPYRARIEYRDETHGSIQPGTPWSLIQNDEPWRPQPQVATGNLRSFVGTLEWDSRNDPADPSAGWLVSAMVEQGIGGSLRYAHAPGGGTPPPLEPRPADSEFTAVALDVRRYLRLGPRTRLAVAARAAGAPDAGPLPPQRQRVLGGEGSLPAYHRFQFDCGARESELTPDGYVPYYGCDRMLLLQAEGRYAILPGFDLGRSLGLDFDLLTQPELVLFANAGRAWIEVRARDDRLDLGPRILRPDVGAGIRLGRLGMYLAVPLSAGRDGPNFFVRLGPRL